jgi:hypothetical protein
VTTADTYVLEGDALEGDALEGDALDGDPGSVPLARPATAAAAATAAARLACAGSVPELIALASTCAPACAAAKDAAAASGVVDTPSQTTAITAGAPSGSRDVVMTIASSL